MGHRRCIHIALVGAAGNLPWGWGHIHIVLGREVGGGERELVLR